MKQVIVILFVNLLFAGSVFSSTLPGEDVKIINSESVVLSVSDDNSEFFEEAIFNIENESLEFVTGENISFIQIFDQFGELNFQLPVMSNKVLISKNLFEAGNYKLGFMIDGKSDIKFTELEIK